MTEKVAAWYATGKVGVTRLVAPLTVRRRLGSLEDAIQAGLPRELHDALRFLVSGAADRPALEVTRRVEARRAQIRDSYSDGIRVWYSPNPSAVEEQTEDSPRPAPGRVMEFSAERVANTGKDRRWGTALYLIVRGFECTTGVELGTCAGISAMYCASAPSVIRYLTVEGSADLCAIARESLAAVPVARVVNALFDEALDDELPSLTGQIDFAFIDGHHERIATIHYADRIIPHLRDGAVVVFDDVSWSADMRAAWHQLRERPEWSHAIDLGAMGICVYHAGSGAASRPRQWDLQPLVGRTRIGRPWGWRA